MARWEAPDARKSAGRATFVPLPMTRTAGSSAFSALPIGVDGFGVVARFVVGAVGRLLAVRTGSVGVVVARRSWRRPCPKPIRDRAPGRHGIVLARSAI